METPSSTRRVTRSQTLSALNNNIPLSKGNKEESEKSVSKTRTTNGKQQQERSALIDITNDSPIVGLAMETPSSAVGKQRSSRSKSMMMTPGSGEALLRGQVRSLLQKVEEEAELSKVSMESRTFLRLQGCVNSPMGLMAPTLANAPQHSNLSEDGTGGINNSGLSSIVMALPVIQEHLKTSEVVSGIFDGIKQEVSLESQKSVIQEHLKTSEVLSGIFDGMKQEVSLESQKSVITRSLLLDFSEQSSESSPECYYVVTDQGNSSACKEKASPDDDYASIWSIQVNDSIDEEEDDEEPIEEMGDEYYEEEEEDDDDDDGVVDELCEDLSKICMKEMFRGKHTRFVYNTDDEIEREEDCGIEDSNDVIRLKGLPTPKGKHLRFPIEEEDE